MSTRPTRKPRWTPGHMLLPQQRDAIVMPVHMALLAMESGEGTIYLRHTIAAFLNIAGVCAARMNAADETRELIDAAKYYLVDSDRRYQRTGKFGFTGPEMLAMRKAVTVSDELIKRANSAVFTYAVAWVSKVNSQTPEVLGSIIEPLERCAA